MELIRHEISGTRSYDALQLKLDLLEHMIWGKLPQCKKSDYPETTMIWRNPTCRGHLKRKMNDYAPDHSNWSARPRCQSKKAVSWTDNPVQTSHDSASVVDRGRFSCIRVLVIVKQYYIWTIKPLINFPIFNLYVNEFLSLPHILFSFFIFGLDHFLGDSHL